MSQIEIPPDLQELFRRLNRVEEMLATVNSTQKALQDYFIALKSEMTKLVEETRLKNKRLNECIESATGSACCDRIPREDNARAHMSIEQDIATIIAKLESRIGKELEEAERRICKKMNEIIVWELKESRRIILERARELFTELKG